MSFFFNDTATTEIYTLSLHDALPISTSPGRTTTSCSPPSAGCCPRSEEHTSELQSHHDLVCRLLLEKKKNKTREAPAYSSSASSHTTANTLAQMHIGASYIPLDHMCV